VTDKPRLAVFGTKPRFSEPLPVGQFYWPEWQRYEKAARDIFSRRFYTSQRFAGPLVVQFQRSLQEFLGVKHAIAIRNATDGLMIATHTFGLRGKVIVPSWTFVATVQALIWSNCQPVFCDIDPESQQLSLMSVRRLLEGGGIKGILGVHLWGDASPVRGLEILADEYGIPLYYDAAHAFGCRVNGKPIGGFGRAEIFSFHATNILSTGEGGCLTTNDDSLAAKFMAMRGDEVSGTGVAMQSATSRMSEMQAAIGLMMLDEFDRNRRNNEEQHRSYEKQLSAIPGIRILKPSGATSSNFQNFVGVVDNSRFGITCDQLLAVLKAENVMAERHFHPPSHLVSPFSKISLEYRQLLQNTELAGRTTFQLPVGARVTAEHIEQLCDVIHEAHRHSESINSVLAPLTATWKVDYR
jgi:dTDP-4-amino-4,6-dideoxygalactose transaminase